MTAEACASVAGTPPFTRVAAPSLLRAVLLACSLAASACRGAGSSRAADAGTASATPDGGTVAPQGGEGSMPGSLPDAGPAGPGWVAVASEDFEQLDPGAPSLAARSRPR